MSSKGTVSAMKIPEGLRAGVLRGDLDAATPEACQQLCIAEGGQCVAFSFVVGDCFSRWLVKELLSHNQELVAQLAVQLVAVEDAATTKMEHKLVEMQGMAGVVTPTSQGASTEVASQ